MSTKNKILALQTYKFVKYVLSAYKTIKTDTMFFFNDEEEWGITNGYSMFLFTSKSVEEIDKHKTAEFYFLNSTKGFKEAFPKEFGRNVWGEEILISKLGTEANMHRFEMTLVYNDKSLITYFATTTHKMFRFISYEERKRVYLTFGREFGGMYTEIANAYDVDTHEHVSSYQDFVLYPLLSVVFHMRKEDVFITDDMWNAPNMPLVIRLAEASEDYNEYHDEGKTIGYFLAMPYKR
jgi:hypothetical protein